MRECDRLREEPSSYPVTFMFMPLKYISHAAAYLKHLFRPEFPTIPYSINFSGQEKEIVDRTIDSLQEMNPKTRLIPHLFLEWGLILPAFKEQSMLLLSVTFPSICRRLEGLVGEDNHQRPFFITLTLTLRYL